MHRTQQSHSFTLVQKFSKGVPICLPSYQLLLADRNMMAIKEQLLSIFGQDSLFSGEEKHHLSPESQVLFHSLQK